MTTHGIDLPNTTWQQVHQQAVATAGSEPMLASFLESTVLNHSNLGGGLSYHLANKLGSNVTPPMLLREVMLSAYDDRPPLLMLAARDLIAHFERDSACNALLTPFLYSKGFLAIQAYRIANWLWQNNRQPLALLLQSRSSIELGIDIHPAAQIGGGIMIDHGNGVVIGETAVVDDNVSMMQSVTLGGTGKESGDRHPKIRRGVLIGAGAKILGNIEVGEGAKVAPASVVLKPVRPHTIVAGVPAEEVGTPECDTPADTMDHRFGLPCIDP